MNVRGKIVNTLKIGDKVIWHTGFYGGEHGRSDRDCWYTIDRECIIIDADIDRYLLELMDKSRRWAKKGEVEDFEIAGAKDREKEVELSKILSAIHNKRAIASK